MINFLLPEAALEMPGLREKTLRDEERRRVESISSKLWAEVRHLAGAGCIACLYVKLSILQSWSKTTRANWELIPQLPQTPQSFVRLPKKQFLKIYT